MAAIVAQVAAFLAVFIYIVTVPARYTSVAVTAALIMSVAQLVLHELAHAFAGWTLRMKLLGFGVGVGQLLGSVKVGSLRFSLRLLPTAVATYLYPSSKTALTRLRLLWFYGSGALVHLVALVASIALAVVASGAAHVVGVTCAFVSGALLVVTLAPSHPRPDQLLGSDGGRIVAAFRLDDLSTETLFAPPEGLAVARLVDGKEPKAAVAELQAHLATSPHDRLARSYLAWFLLVEERFDESLEQFEWIIEHVDLDLHSKAMISNAMAWLTLCSNRDARQALAHSEASLRVHPWDLYARSTNGCARVATGDPGGAEDIRAALKLKVKGRSQAARYAFLAIADSQQGYQPQAQLHVRVAEMTAPGWWLTVQARGIVGPPPPPNQVS